MVVPSRRVKVWTGLHRSMLWCALMAALITSMALAEPHVSVNVSPSVGDTSETYALQIVVEGVDLSDLAVPELLPSADFRVQYVGPSSQLSIINGSVSQSVAFQYSLKPLREGTLTTPTGTVRSTGETLSIGSVIVTVSQSSPESQPDGVGVLQAMNKTVLYLGEQAAHSFEIYGTEAIVNPVVGDLVFDDFRKVSYGKEQYGRRVVAGQVHNTVVFKHALYPLRSGTIILPPRSIQGQVRDRRRQRDPFGSSLFDDLFYGGSLRAVTLSSAPITIDVKPLPPPPKDFPVWFNSAGSPLAELVGGTGLKLEYDQTPVALGEGKKVVVTVTSLGNLSAVRSVNIKAPNHVKIYQSSPAERINDSGDALVVERRFDITLLPTVAGPIEIPGLELGYFDLTSATHKIARTGAITFLAVPGRDGATAEPTSNSAPAQPVETQPPALMTPTALPTIAPYADVGLVEKIGQRFGFGLGAFVGAMVMALLALGYAIRRVRAANAPIRALTRVTTLPEVERLLAELLWSRYHIQLQGSAPHSLEATLRLHGVPTELRVLFTEIYQEINQHKDTERQEIGDRLGKLLQEVGFD